MDCYIVWYRIGDEDNGSVWIVWWPEYINGSVEFDHEEIDLIPV